MATASERAIASPNGPTNLAEIPEEILQRRYNLSRAELNAIKAALAPPNTSDYEVMLYVGVCQRMHLDPFVPGLVHFAKFWNKEKNAYRTGIIIGVYGYIALAQQDPAYDGFDIRSFPEDPEKPVSYAECSVYRKGSSHPTVVRVLAKEARSRSDSKNWNESPRHMTENAAIRRAMKYAYPTLFGAVDEPEPDDEAERHGLPEVKGKVGTVLGEHHDAPVAEARVVEPPASAGKPATPANTPPDTPAPAESAPTATDIKFTATLIRDILDDPALDEPLYQRATALVDNRLEAMGVPLDKKIWDVPPEKLPSLKALLADLRTIVPGS